jgi:hypothetical protein
MSAPFQDSDDPEENRLKAVWNIMLWRCSDAATGDLRRNYYDRGIRVCPEWESFETWLAWAKAAGSHPDLQIDRIDNDGDYSPENCRWITIAEQQRNRSDNTYVEAFGESHIYAEWAEHELAGEGVTDDIIRSRIKRYGWSPERAIAEAARHQTRSVPLRVANPVTLFGETKISRAWAADERISVSHQTAYDRVSHGGDPEAALLIPPGHTGSRAVLHAGGRGLAEVAS